MKMNPKLRLVKIYCCHEEIFTKLMNDEKMMKIASKHVGKDVWERLRVDG
jgi:hypothetical protein